MSIVTDDNVTKQKTKLSLRYPTRRPTTVLPHSRLS